MCSVNRPVVRSRGIEPCNQQQLLLHHSAAADRSVYKVNEQICRKQQDFSQTAILLCLSVVGHAVPDFVLQSPLYGA